MGERAILATGALDARALVVVFLAWIDSPRPSRILGFGPRIRPDSIRSAGLGAAGRWGWRAGMAGRKRKADAARAMEEEADRALYGAFRGAANSLSQLYTLAGGHQRVAFHAGERHAMEKLYQWILRQHENGLRLTVSDIVSHIQHEIEYGGEDALASQRSQCTIQNLQTSMLIPNTSNQQTSLSSANPGLHSKNSIVFSNALSSPVRRSLQPYHLQQGGATEYFADGIVCTGSHESNSAASNDSSVDMHSDSPAHES